MLDFAPREYQYIGLVVLAFVLLRIPTIGRYFRVVNTLFHESGHALIALFTSGSVERIDLFADTSGACVYRSRYWLSRLLVNLAGYPASSAAAWLMCYALHYNHTQWLLYGLAGLCVLNLLLWVRNRYGIYWLLSFLVLLAICFYLDNAAVNFYFLFLVAALNLVESVYSAWVLLYLSFSDPRHSGDARNLRQLTFIPSFFWALFFVVQALLVAVLTVEMLWDIQIL